MALPIVVADTLDQAGYNNLHLLCTRARSWVEKQFDELCDHLTTELEKEPHNTLYRREGIIYTLPRIEHLDVPRNAP